jgi:hypothetical protein
MSNYDDGFRDGVTAMIVLAFVCVIIGGWI